MVQIGRRGTARRLFEISQNSQKSQNSNFKILVHHFLRLCLLTEEIHFEVFPYDDSGNGIAAAPHDARRDIVIKPAARRRAANEARGHSELRAFGTGGAIGP